MLLTVSNLSDYWMSCETCVTCHMKHALQLKEHPKLEYSSSIWHPNNIKLINRLEPVQQKAAWWTPQKCCRISSVNNMLTARGWPYLQHRCRKARLVNTRWLSQYHKSPSFPFPVIPSAHLSSVVLTTGSSPFSPQCNQGLKWPHWGCCCCTHPWVFLFTSSKISTIGVGHAPPVSSVDDG